MNKLTRAILVPKYLLESNFSYSALKVWSNISQTNAMYMANKSKPVVTTKHKQLKCCKLPSLSPRLIFVQQSFLVGLYLERACFLVGLLLEGI